MVIYVIIAPPIKPCHKKMVYIKQIIIKWGFVIYKLIPNGKV